MKKCIKILCTIIVGIFLVLGVYILYDRNVSSKGFAKDSFDGSSGVAQAKGINLSRFRFKKVSGTVSIKDFGAVGDGIQNDYAAFAAALNSGADEVYIPAGTYELGGGIVVADIGVNIVGESQSDTIIKHGCISTKYGISASNLTFEGGAVQKIDYTGGRAEESTISLMVSPSGQQNVSYKDCTFRNVTVASFAREQEGSFASNEVIGCTFTNIRKVAIYHCLNIGNGTYKNNLFNGFGGSDLTRGFVSALWIGDISNNTYVQAVNTVIDGNTFANLVTKDDYSEANHIINANFIAIRGDTAVISNNSFTNLAGYGNDREAVYTKVRDLTITNNTITNGGLGEGYICNKSQSGDSYCTITGNTIVGEKGTGIRNYVPGTITGNTISISNCSSAITNTQRTDITGNRELIIRDNIISSGTYAEGGSKSTGKAIRVSGVVAPITIERNAFNTSTAFEHYISVGNPGVSVTIRDNSISGKDNAEGTGISVYSNKNGGKLSPGCQVVVERNSFAAK